MGRRQAADAAQAPGGGDGAAAAAPPTAASIAAQAPAQAGGNAEPMARESRHLTEMRALNREVTLVVEGVDKFNNLFATMLLPAAAPAPAENMSELLVKEGLAKAGLGRLHAPVVLSPLPPSPSLQRRGTPACI